MKSARPRVLVAITLAEVGGAQAYVANLLPALAERFDVTVAAHGSGPLPGAARAAGATFVPLRHVRRPINPWRDALGLVELFRLCRRICPRIFHANSSKVGVLGMVAAGLAGVPIRIFTPNCWPFLRLEGPSSAYLWASRLIGRLATCVICVSEHEQAAGVAARACRLEKTVVIPNAVDVRSAARARPDAEEPRLLSVGRLTAQKDFTTLLRAIARLERGSLTALIVGDGPDRGRLEEEMRHISLDGIVEFSGERHDVQALLAGSQVFALATNWEGLPISILEAMAAGLPVVASAVGGVSELVIDGETGILVGRGDVEGFAAALTRLAREPQLRAQLGAAGRARAERLFDLRRFRRAHLELYDALLAGRFGGSAAA